MSLSTSYQLDDIGNAKVEFDFIIELEEEDFDGIALLRVIL